MTTVVGERVVRQDGRQKVTGAAYYTADMTVTGMAHGAFLYAPHARARILRLDVTAARALPGVYAVVTQVDAPPDRYGGFVKDRTVFACEEVRFAGEVVAAVAAQTPDIAALALEHIDVEYEPLDPIVDVEQALDGADLVHPDWEQYATGYPNIVRQGNDHGRMTTVRGDVASAFAVADLIVEERYVSDMAHAVPIEPHAIVAQWNGDQVTVWSSSQVPFLARAATAQILGIPESRVRIVVPYLGGGFGGKCDVHFEPHLAILARAARRPVRLVFSRREEFTAVDKTHGPMQIDIKTGVMRDGTIVAREGRLVIDAGAYAADGPYATEIGMMMFANGYRIENISIEAHSVYTNRTPSGSVRAPGGPQVCWAVEQHTDVLAARLGLDPVEFRRRNLVADGDVGPTGQVFEAPLALTCLERAIEESGYADALGPGEGVGVACAWWYTLPLASGAFVRINADGSGTIITGAQENGSGAVMALPMLAAEALGMSAEDFSIIYQDTETGPWDLGSAGSQTTCNNGRAVTEAALEVREQLLDLASDVLEIDAADLELSGGHVRPVGDPSRAVAIATLAQTAQGGRLLLGKGSGDVPAWTAHDASGCVGRLGYSVFPHPTFSCHVAKVRVDAETGVTQVLDYTAVHDVGHVLNPIGAEGQVDGGVVHGIGLALSEGTLHREGRQVNPNLLDYKLRTAADAPPIRIAFVGDGAPGVGPHGAKSLGEQPVIAPAAAVANAIAAATGARVHALPMTPPRVWRAIRQDGTT
ncbi:MAG: xanthine dehydrogenase family protein molybdopterin-binding subunit [Solirubrobacteraceae bacterium]